MAHPNRSTIGDQFEWNNTHMDGTRSIFPIGSDICVHWPTETHGYGYGTGVITSYIGKLDWTGEPNEDWYAVEILKSEPECARFIWVSQYVGTNSTYMVPAPYTWYRHHIWCPFNNRSDQYHI